MAKKKSVLIDIQYQIKVPDEEGEGSKTYEYQHAAKMNAARAGATDPLTRELNLLKFLVKEFKAHARQQKRQLAKQQKRAAKARKSIP